MTEAQQLLESIKLQTLQIEKLTQAIGVMTGVMGEMLEEIACQNIEEEDGPDKPSYLDDESS